MAAFVPDFDSAIGGWFLLASFHNAAIVDGWIIPCVWNRYCGDLRAGEAVRYDDWGH